jgi:hypothetical protein
MQTPTRERFNARMKEIASAIAGRAVDKSLESFLSERFAEFSDIESLCRQAMDEGWMCDQGQGDRRWGRVIDPNAEMMDFSVDVVSMAHGNGPHHSHPLGEIVLTLPQTPAARFDSRGAGWLVYPPGSSHYPTVTGGLAWVLYLLPQGKIAFTK